MTWTKAMAVVKKGGKVRRPGWPDLDYVLMVDGLLFGKRKFKTAPTYFPNLPQQWLWAKDWEVVDSVN